MPPSSPIQLIELGPFDGCRGPQMRAVHPTTSAM